MQCCKTAFQMRLSAEPDPFIQNGQDWRFSNEAGDDHLLLLLKQVKTCFFLFEIELLSGRKAEERYY